ncbi:hypothetical protein O3M35_011145 [Rhynocoris fuscipes]|uniref:Uncharacterized protein n=1 Tax=Rhynocoris fuscipes TaxID=488301 RepID=A0AAW1CWH7_9HEMI
MMEVKRKVGPKLFIVKAKEKDRRCRRRRQRKKLEEFKEPIVGTEIQFDLNIDKVSLKISALSPYLFSNVTRCDRGDEQP